MYKILRMIFSIVSAVCVAAVFPVGALVNWSAAIVCALAAFLFFGLTLLCKQKQETEESKLDLPYEDEENGNNDQK